MKRNSPGKAADWKVSTVDLPAELRKARDLWSEDQARKMEKLIRANQITIEEAKTVPGPFHVSLLEVWDEEDLQGKDWDTLSLNDVRDLVRRCPLDLERMLLYSTVILLRFEFLRRDLVQTRRRWSQILQRELESVDECISRGIKFHRDLLADLDKRNRSEEIHIQVVQPLIEQLTVVIRQHVSDESILRNIGESFAQIYETPQRIK